MDYISTIPQLEKLAAALDFGVGSLFVEEWKLTVFSGFKSSEFTDEEQAREEHLMKKAKSQSN